MPKYFREVNKHFSGDKTLAVRYMGVARSLLGGLVEMSGDLLQNARKVVLPDGTKIIVSFAGQIANIAIDAAKDYVQLAASKYCRPFLSGLLSVEQVVVNSSTESNGEAYEYKSLNWLYTSDYQKQIAPNIGDKISVKEFASDKFITNGFGPNPLPVTYESVYASSYTGTMRTVIQLLLGMGLELVEYKAGPVVKAKYNSCHTGTHGIVLGYGHTEEKPNLYLVRMPIGGFGILAMPFPVCTGVTEKQKDAGVNWIPDLINFPEDIASAIADGKVKELITYSEMSDFMDGLRPITEDCGWSFSLSGHECQTVMLSEWDDAGDPRVGTKRLKVSFSVTEKSDTNFGLEASLHSYERKVLAGVTNSLPRFPFSYATTLLPVGQSIAEPGSYQGSVECDVYVFYKGDNEQVFSYVFDRSKESGPWKEGNFWNAVTTDQHVPCEGVYHGIYHYSGQSRTYYTLNGQPITAALFQGGYSEYNFEIVIEPHPAAFIRHAGLTVSSALGIGVKYDEYVKPVTTFGQYATMLIPFNQREGVYVLDGSYSEALPYSVYMAGISGVLGVTKHTVTITYPFQDPYTGCTDGLVQVVATETVPLCSPVTSFYPDLPQVYEYTRTLIGGIGMTSATGCIESITTSGYDTIVSSTITDSISAETIVQGSLDFYSSGSDISIEFAGTNEEIMDRIDSIMSISYLAGGSTLYILGYTDGIKPHKYLIASDINTTVGDDYLTNTSYQLDGLDSWGKSFVGIAN